MSPQMEYILTLNIRFTPVDDAMEPLVLVNEIHHPSLSQNITLPCVSLWLIGTKFSFLLTNSSH